MDRILLTDGHVDLRRQVVRRPPHEVALTTRECELLRFLAQNPGRTLSRQELLQRVWGYRGGVVTRTVDSTIKRLRQKIEPDRRRPQMFLTVFGEGYRFEPFTPQASAEPPPSPALVGRSPALRLLEGWLAEPGVVVVSGTAGVGKSALARHALQRWQAAGLWCDRVLPPADELAEGALVVVDEAASTSAAISMAAARPDLRLLLTRRPSPAGGRVLRLEPLSAEAAAQLWHQQRPQAPPEPQTPALLAALGRLPAALVMATPLRAVLSDGELLAALEARAASTAGLRRALAALAEPCWSALSRDEQAALRALGTLQGSFSLALAEAVQPGALVHVAHLEQRGLLRAQGSPRRFSLYTSVRHVLDAQPAPMAALVGGCCQLAPAMSEADQLAEQGSLLAAIRHAVAHDRDAAAALLVALEGLISHLCSSAEILGWLRAVDHPGSALGLLSMLARHLISDFALDEGRAALARWQAAADTPAARAAAWLERARLERRCLDRAAAADALARAAALAEGGEQRGRVCVERAWQRQLCGDLAGAQASLREAIALLRPAPRPLAGAYRDLAMVCLTCGCPAEAVDVLERALALRAGFAGQPMPFLVYLHASALVEVEPDRAAALLPQAAAALGAQGARYHQGMATVWAGLAQAVRGRLREARTLLDEGIDLIGGPHRHEGPWFTPHRAAIEAALGNATQAHLMLQEAARDQAAAGTVPVWRALFGLAWACCESPAALPALCAMPDIVHIRSRELRVMKSICLHLHHEPR